MQYIPGPILEAIESLGLPSVPSLLVNFLHATADEGACTSALAQLVMQEPGLAARVLTVANSAAFRRGSELGSIQQALQVLGTRTLRNLGACLALQSVMGQLPGTRPDDLAGFWRHSLVVAELARAIADEVGHGDAEEAYLAGLLHDIGQLLLLGGLGPRYGQMLSRALLEDELVALERAELATDHGAAGAWLVGQWKLPSFMADAILFHHHPAAEVTFADPLTRILWVANASATLLAQGEPLMEAFVTIGDVVNVDGPALALLCGRAADSVAALAAALGVAGSAQTTPVWRAPDAAVAPDPLHAAVLSMALQHPLQQDFASMESETALLDGARESARILFGLGEVAFFLRSAGESVLQAAVLSGQAPQLQQLTVRLDPPHSLCAQVALKGQMGSSFDPGRASTAPALSELQLSRVLGSDGLLCVPMRAGGSVLGVMVCGVSKMHHGRLLRQAALLGHFADLAAGALDSWRVQRSRARQIGEDVASHYRLRAREVAHEAGNPLGIIKNYLRIVDSKLPQTGLAMEEMQILRQEVDRVARIVRQLDSDAGPALAAAGSLDLNGVLEGLRLLYRASLFDAAGRSLVLELQSPLAPTLAERDSIKQIVLNLWKNAAEASPPGGSVVVSTADNVHQDGRTYTELRVRDSGPGLPDEVLQHLYEPLEPARPGHAGLGLSIVHGLVQKLGGHISCSSRAESGTTFIVRLPQASRRAA